MSQDAISNLISLAINNQAADPEDSIYLRNRTMALVGEKVPTAEYSYNPQVIIDALVNLAIQNNKISNSITDKELLASQLMDIAAPLPSAINREFNNIFNQRGSLAATTYFYNLCKSDNDIQTAAIKKNIEFTANKLEITINLSKPEKDPKAIAAALHQTDENKYPKCQLCLENEGYLGRVGYPARSNHRVIRINVNENTWGFQYSPYAYFPEHAIFIDQDHVPMKISKQTFKNLFEIIDKFPHYFVGSNADLPIVGGSMLTHEHYQGGRHSFPMMKASISESIQNPLDNNSATIGIVNWPMTAFRIQSNSKEDVVNTAEFIRQRWFDYTDISVDIRAFTDNERHHTVTPIAYFNDDKLYTLDIVLRDNQTSEKYPDGIFHPHKDVQHIKKENIGLIEVMGRAIFPPRLVSEMNEVQKYLLNKDNKIADYHLPWAKEIKKKHSKILEDNVEGIVHEEIGTTFEEVLKDAGVFKWNIQGRKALDKFVKSLY
ncbi:UDP-glucose--hexose-1-phosphate uridylyltransferase [Pediococcus argentinicus]|nr:UDP-glucose--hexose-1-phosphate uridylyltransferase [Pediococcus argentinicus]NKZ22245.1 UDP-glucose--hexose-1-phosphate uridylyltransferase [Pediococcus argentinicus]GEP19286.1 galactose-1-phosphate uridylyltransferase [Pediococcus argentinicus]